MGITSIEWTDVTWNPVRGCSRVSEGCRNCYAERQGGRWAAPGKPYHGLVKLTKAGPRWTGRVELIERHLEDPLQWRRPLRVFTNSMSDLFHEKLRDEQIDRVFAVMALASQHTFQCLTKRPERAVEYLATNEHVPMAFITEARVGREATAIARRRGENVESAWWDLWWTWPLPNIQIGTSVENVETKHRIDTLRRVNAAVRFLSLEPLLEDLGTLDLTGIHWVIVGGESGPGARPCDLGWVYSIVEQCRVARVPVFVKQLGAVPMMDQEIWDVEPLTKLLSASNRNRVPQGFVPLKFADRKGGDWDEWPAELRVREFPGVV